MRLSRFAAVLLLLLPSLAGAGTIPGLTSKKLPNGLEVIVVENHAVPLVTVEIADEIRKMRTTPADPNQVRDSANTIHTSILQQMEASGDIASWLARFEVRGGGWENLDAFLARLSALTPEEVRQAMDKYAKQIDFAVLGKLEGIDPKSLTAF